MNQSMRKLSVNKDIVINYVFSIGLILIFATILIVLQGSNPIIAFTEIIKGSMIGKASISSSIRWAIPVIISSQAAVVAHRSGINNLGLEGQLYFGALAAAIVGAFVSLPHVPHVLVALLVGGLAGLLYAVIPALLKIKLDIDEMITTLMFNYIAILMTEYITMSMMGLNAGTNPDLIATPEILPTANLTQLMPPYQASTGIIIAIIISIVIHYIYKKFKTGYEWKLVGDNYTFSKYGGIKVVKRYLGVFLLSGFIAGIVGAVEILGPHKRFRNSFSVNLGWDGIMVALIAKNKPIPTLVVATIWGFIKAGSLSMERMTSVNRIIVTLVQALFVLFITVDIRQKVVDFMKKRKEKKEEKKYA